MESYYTRNFFINIDIFPDENCFFRRITKFFSCQEDNHLYFRNLAFNYINNNIQFFKNTNNNIEYNNKVITLD